MDNSLISYFQSNINYFPSDVLKWMKINAKPGISSNGYGSWDYCKFNDDDEEINVAETLDIFPDKHLWITNYVRFVFFRDTYNHLIKNILPKIAFCQAQELIINEQYLSLEEFKILTSSGSFEHVSLDSTTITDSNGMLVVLECVLQCLPNVVTLFFEKIVPSFVTYEAAERATVSSKLTRFMVHLMTDAFNFDTFSKFMITHPFICFQIMYDSIKSPKCGQQIEEFFKKYNKNPLISYTSSVVFCYHGQHDDLPKPYCSQCCGVAP